MNILSITSSVSGDKSTSTQLTEAIVGKLLDKEPGSNVMSRNLAQSNLPHYGEEHFKTLFLRQDDNQPESHAIRQLSDELFDEVAEADTIVIGLPLYNLGIPSTLKAWLDHINLSGKTFRYGEHGPEGLLQGKKVYLAISTGGIYSTAPAKAYDFTEPYLRTIFGFMGISDITVVRVEGTAVPAVKETALETAIEGIVV